MLNQRTIEKLHTMKLHGMADAFHAQLETTDVSQLSFEERFALLVDQQWLWKENRALARRLRFAHLKERGVIEDIDYQHPRGLDRKLMRTLATSEWVHQHHHLLLIGPTGIGKSWLGCALAQKACRDGFSVLHKRTSELFRELAAAHADGSIGRLLVRLSRIDVLLLDDFAMAPLKDTERRDFLEICDDRYQRRSRSGESFQTQKRFSSAAHKTRALASCGPFRRLSYEKGKEANAKAKPFRACGRVLPPDGRPRPHRPTFTRISKSHNPSATG